MLVDGRGEMYLIDWGNCISLKGRWKPLWEYVSGAVCADVELLATALITMSADPERSERRRAEIQATLAQTLEKKRVTPLNRFFLLQIHKEGWRGLHRRLQVVFHLMSNTQHLGLVVKSEYLHLSRSLAAIAGTYLQLYNGQSRYLLIFDLIRTLTQFPLTIMLERISDDRSARYLKLIHKLPILPIMKNSAPKYLPRRAASSYLPN